MKKKVEKYGDTVLVPCKKCGEHFWPFYNFFKENGVVENYCVSCKGEIRKKSKLDDDGREIK